MATTRVKKGDPLEPLLFPLVHQISNNCKFLLYVWYLEDGTIIGDSVEVARVLYIIKVPVQYWVLN